MDIIVIGRYGSGMASGAGLIERLIAVGRPDLAERLKHLAGQHPQQRHGYRFGKNMTLAQARRQRERGTGAITNTGRGCIE